MSGPFFGRVFVHAIPAPVRWRLSRVKDVYAVLRQKELEYLRLENEVDALRIVAPFLSEDGEAQVYDQLRSRQTARDNPQPDHSGWEGGVSKVQGR